VLENVANISEELAVSLFWVEVAISNTAQSQKPENRNLNNFDRCFMGVNRPLL
jgi:hypothetical protein